VALSAQVSGRRVARDLCVEQLRHVDLVPAPLGMKAAHLCIAQDDIRRVSAATVLPAHLMWCIGTDRYHDEQVAEPRVLIGCDRFARNPKWGVDQPSTGNLVKPFREPRDVERGANHRRRRRLRIGQAVEDAPAVHSEAGKVDGDVDVLSDGRGLLTLRVKGVRFAHEAAVERTLNVRLAPRGPRSRHHPSVRPTKMRAICLLGRC
jgi:hypothetical protein